MAELNFILEDKGGIFWKVPQNISQILGNTSSTIRLFFFNERSKLKEWNESSALIPWFEK